jgi:hypothetical protein
MARKVTRRAFVQAAALSGLAASAKPGWCANGISTVGEKTAGTQGLTPFVDVFIDDASIMGFSHTHLSQAELTATAEDCGQVSAWYIMSALGFYAVDPVSGNYAFGSPLFDRAAIALGNGKTLVIQAEGNAPDKPYVQSVTWDGNPYTKSWFSHAADCARREDRSAHGRAGE